MATQLPRPGRVGVVGTRPHTAAAANPDQAILSLVQALHTTPDEEEKRTLYSQVEDRILNSKRLPDDQLRMLHTVLPELHKCRKDADERNRKSLISLLERIGLATPPVLHFVFDTYETLLKDDSKFVLRQLCTSTTNLLTTTLQQLGVGKENWTDEHTKLYDAFSTVREALLDMIQAPDEVISLLSVKLHERIGIAFYTRPDQDTWPDDHPRMTREAFQATGLNSRSLLAEAVKNSQLPCMVLCVLISALRRVIVERPEACSELRDLLVSLRPSEAYRSKTSAERYRLRHALATSLLFLLVRDHPSSEPAITQALRRLDYSSRALELHKKRYQDSSRLSRKRRRPDSSRSLSQSSKRAAPGEESQPFISVPASSEYNHISLPTNDLQSKAYQELLSRFYSLSPSLVTGLVIKSMDHLHLPGMTANQRSGGPGQLFIQFLAAFQQTRPRGRGSAQFDYSPADPRIRQVAEQAKSLEEKQRELPKRRALTKVPPIPVKPMTRGLCKLMAKGAFDRLVSADTERSVEQAGQSAARSAILCKLATSPFSTQSEHEALYNHILEDFSKRSELALRWLYCLVPENVRANVSETLAVSAADATPMNIDEAEEGGDTQLAESLSAYNHTLLRILDGLPAGMLDHAPLLTRFLVDLPIFTPDVFLRVQRFCEDPRRISLGLAVLVKITRDRSALREEALSLLLAYSHHESQLIRNSTIHSIVERLYVDDETFKADIEQHAVTIMKRLETPWKEAGDAVSKEENVDFSEGEAAEEEGEEEDKMDVDEEEEKQPAKEEPIDESTLTPEQKINLERERVRKEAEAAEAARIAAIREKERIEREAKEKEQRRIDSHKRHVTQHLDLLIALCLKDLKLVAELAKQFSKFDEFVRAEILRTHLPRLLTVVEKEPGALHVLEEGADSSDAFSLRLLDLASKGDTVPEEAVAVAKALYKRRKNARLLLPVLRGLDRAYLAEMLPRLLRLSLPDVKLLINTILKQGNSLMAPADLLVYIHILPIPTPQMIEAVELCLKERSIFRLEQLAMVLTKLLEQRPLPKLLMRTLLQTLVSCPPLTKFAVRLLSDQIAATRLWEDKILWKGFIKYCHRTAPASLQIILQLPDSALEQFMEATPDKVKTTLRDHARPVASRLRRGTLKALGLG